MTNIQTLHLGSVIEKHTRDMSGKVVAITGTTSGTGYVCARELAKLGARVLLQIGNIKPLLAHPGHAITSLAAPTAETGGMNLESDIMSNAQSAEDGALGIIRACADPEAQSGDFYGPEGWTGFPQKLPPEELLLDPENIKLNWAGCEAAVGPFSFDE